MEFQDRNKMEVTNLIEPILLTKLHIQNVGRSGINAMAELVDMVCLNYRLNPRNGGDFRVAIKIIEQSIYQN